MKKPVLLAVAFFAAVLISRSQEIRLLVKNSDKGLYLEHKVVSGEGLFSVGRLYNISPKHIAAYNLLDPNKGLEIDQVVMVPLTDTNFTQKTNKGVPVYYTVNTSDGLFKVSNTHRKVPVQKLKEWNDLKSDNINVGSDLVIGYFISKPMQTLVANSKIAKPEVVEEKIAVKTDPPKTDLPKTNQPKTEIPKDNKEITTAVSIDPVKSETPTFAKQENKGSTAAMSYFQTYFEQQTVANPISRNTSVTSGIFKTSSGWQDGKYYLLIDGVPSGSIIKVVNPENNKAIYAKVLGEMNGIRQNQGLGIRISNAGASALGVADTEKFVVTLNY